MIRRSWLAVLFVLLWPCTSPAPLIYRPGEGWTYEPVGGAKWQRARAKEQLEVAQQAFDEKHTKLALKAAKRTVSKWPLSDYAPQAQYLVGRSYEALHQDQRAFQAYQRLLEKYPKVSNYQEVLHRQFEIANRFLGGQWTKLWGVIPWFPSMEKTADMYSKLIKNGPYSEVAPQAQLNIGQAREKQKNYPEAVKAYEVAADRYSDQEKIASAAVYKSGEAYMKQAQTAEYDQGASGQAIEAFQQFVALYPNDGRVPTAQTNVSSLRAEQARGSFNTARFYEKRRRWNGALIYYNEVVVRDRESELAEEAQRRIDEIRKLRAAQPQKKS